MVFAGQFWAKQQIAQADGQSTFSSVHLIVNVLELIRRRLVGLCALQNLVME